MSATRPCDHCGMALYPDDLFCPGCGQEAAPIEMERTPSRRSSRIVFAVGSGAHPIIDSCARCGSEVLPGDRYCQMCGAAQPPR